MAVATKLIPDVKLVSSSSKSLEEHRRCCKDPKVCSNCAWVSKGGAWRSHFPWLRAGFAGNSNILTVGCKICALHAAKFTAAGSDTSQLSPYATFSVRPEVTWKSWRFRHHAQSKYHIAAHAADPTSHAPAAEEWQDLVRKLSRGHSQRDKGDGTPSTRTKLMHYCLSEAILHAYRVFLASAQSITLMRGESCNLKQMFLI
jgi:hypothetical protein